MKSRPTSPKGKDAWRAFLLPKFRRVRWTWGRWLLLGLAMLALADELLMPISRLDAGQSEGLLALIVVFRAMAPADPPVAVSVVGACLVGLLAAMARGFIKEASPVWTPIVLALLLFLLFTWRWGRKDAPPDSTRE